MEISTTPDLDALQGPIIHVPKQTTPRDAIAFILDHQFVTTHRGGYYKFLVRWKNRPKSDSVWLQATELKRLHLELFDSYVRQKLVRVKFFRGSAVDANQEVVS